MMPGNCSDGSERTEPKRLSLCTVRPNKLSAKQGLVCISGSVIQAQTAADNGTVLWLTLHRRAADPHELLLKGHPMAVCTAQQIH